jgi:hypothetical protein
LVCFSLTFKGIAGPSKCLLANRDVRGNRTI